MRYQSFYPFSRQQQPQMFGMRQPDFGPPPMQQAGQQFPRQMFSPPPMGNQFGPPSQGVPQQSGSKMEMYMQTANRFLNTAQQFAPLVQQFSPMLQNLPAMWKLYKGFQSLPSTGAQAGPTAGSGGLRAVQPTPPSPTPGPSTPRIFQPPTI